jgi:hypothetical protein
VITFIGRAFVLGAYVFVVTLLAGFIGHTINLENWKLVVMTAIAGIAAGLGFVGFLAAEMISAREKR